MGDAVAVGDAAAAVAGGRNMVVVIRLAPTMLLMPFSSFLDFCFFSLVPLDLSSPVSFSFSFPFSFPLAAESCVEEDDDDNVVDFVSVCVLDELLPVSLFS